MENSPVAVITGGQGDLAGAIMDRLRSEGWTVHAPGRREMDVRDSEQVRSFFQSLERVDLLVNQAAVTRDVPLVLMQEDDFNLVVETTLSGAFRCAREAAQKMIRQKSGHLLQIGSWAALNGTAGQANYAAAKAGLIGLTHSLAAEYGAHNVRANCILPGFLETSMTRQILADETDRQSVLEKHVLGRLNTVSDAARFIVFMNTMSHVSGQVFQIDSRLHRWA